MDLLMDNWPPFQLDYTFRYAIQLGYTTVIILPQSFASYRFILPWEASPFG